MKAVALLGTVLGVAAAVVPVLPVASLTHPAKDTVGWSDSDPKTTGYVIYLAESGKSLSNSFLFELSNGRVHRLGNNCNFVFTNLTKTGVRYQITIMATNTNSAWSRFDTNFVAK